MTGNKIRRTFLLILALFFALLVFYMFKPLSNEPHPADFHCLVIGKDPGRLTTMNLKPKQVYGIGLSYSSHIKETASNFDPGAMPPIFMKKTESFIQGGSYLSMPKRQAILDALDKLEPELGKKIGSKYETFPLLLDYEVELAFVLLEDIDLSRINDKNYMPKLGYLIVNDFSIRTIAILGEGLENRYDYWGASKSFPGFLPAGKQVWIPEEQKTNSYPCIELCTKVNNEVRQKQSTRDQVYTPKQLLQFIIKKYPQVIPGKGDIVLTGTPGGVALQVPVWKARIGSLVGLDRFSKLSATISSNKENPQFLQVGDKVEISGKGLGAVTTTIAK